MAGIQNSEEALEGIYKVLSRGQDSLLEAQQSIITAIHSVSNDWNDDKYVEVAKMAREMIDGHTRSGHRTWRYGAFCRRDQKKAGRL